MSDIRILNIEPDSYSNEARKICESIGLYDEVSMSREEILAILSKYDVLITRLGYNIDAGFFKATDNLKVIVSATTGLDHIDLDMAEINNVTVLSLKNEAEYLSRITATSELAWGLLLSVMRHIPHASNDVNQGLWCRDKFKGNQLSSKTLGIIGLGRLGLHVMRYGIAFGMKVIAYDPYIEKWPDNIRRVEQLNDVFHESDVISIHVPLNKQTENMIGKEQFDLLKGNAVLINTSRGAIIDEEELLIALRNKKLAGAGLDVIKDESNFDDTNELLRYAKNNKNLVITPHIGGLTFESMVSTEVFMARKLEKHIASIN